jgi:hypothetical protein
MNIIPFISDGEDLTYSIIITIYKLYIYIYIYACFEQIIEFGLFKIDPNYLDAYIILYEL